MNRRVDVLALVCGLGALLLGATVLWTSFGGTPTTWLVKVGVPLALVAVGGLGLLASRH